MAGYSAVTPQFETADIIRIGLAVLHAWLSREKRLWTGRSSQEPNQIHKLNYGSSARISADRNLMHFYLLLNSVCLELRSASESIQPVKIHLGRPKFEFDLAHVKYGVGTGPKRLLSNFPGRRVVFWSAQDMMTSVTGSDISLP